ncbi:MAG: extracellular solute-binding protein [Clostridia bacterium]
MRKFIALFLALVLCLAMLGGCKTEPKPVEPTQEEITWWAFPTFAKVGDEVGKYERSVVAEFNKKYPNIKVNVEMIDFATGPDKITNAIAAGTQPDIVFDAPGRIIAWGSAGKLANFDEMFTAEYKKDINNENLVKSCSNGKNYYMYPLSSAPFTMALNQTLLEKEGLMDMINTKGDRTWTTDQFTALNAALAKKGHKNSIIFCKSQGGDQGTRAFMTNLFGAHITNNDLTKYTMDSPEAIKAMKYVMDQVKAGNLESGIAYDGGGAIEQFVQGIVAGTILWAPGNDLGNKAKLDAAGVKQIALPFPSDDGKPELEYLVNGFCIFDKKDAKRVENAKTFLKFICDDPVMGKQNVKQTNAFPVRSSFGDLYPGNENMAFYSSLTKYYGTYYNTIDGYAKMRPEWWQNLQAAMTGDKTAEKAMQDYNAKANASIKG